MLTGCSDDLTLEQWKNMLAKLRINKPNTRILDFKSYYVTQVGLEYSFCLSLDTLISTRIIGMSSHDWPETLGLWHLFDVIW